MEAMMDDRPERDEWDVLILPNPRATYEDPNESTEKDAEKATYELDLQFPPEEVPILYRDGEMTPVIDEDSDLLTGSRVEVVDGEAVEIGADADTDSTATTSADAQAVMMTTDEIQEIMDTFEQIQLEIETKRLIDSYRREYTNKELKRLDEIEGVFGAKHPGEIELWMSVWDHWSRSYDTGIAKAYLPDATMTATGLTRAKAKDAVAIAEDFELLIKATPADTDDPNVDEDTTILRLVQPEERPDLFVESTADLKAFADREKWVDIWETLNDPSEPFKRGQLNTLVERLTFADTQTEVDAVVAVGVLCGSLTEEEDDYVRLCSERPRDIWLRVWEQLDAPLNHPLPANEIQLSLGIELLDTDISGENYFESALEHNELYSPEDLADDQYVVNDPASEAGPEIIEREGPDPFDHGVGAREGLERAGGGDADDGRPGPAARLDPRRGVLEHDAVLGPDPQPLGGEPIRLRVGLAALDVVGRDQRVGDGEPDVREPVRGRASAPAGGDGPPPVRQPVEEGPGPLERAELLGRGGDRVAHAVGLGVGVEVRGHLPDDLERRAAVVDGLDLLERHVAELGPLPPALPDGGLGVDEHPVEVEEQGTAGKRHGRGRGGAGHGRSGALRDGKA